MTETITLLLKGQVLHSQSGQQVQKNLTRAWKRCRLKTAVLELTMAPFLFPTRRVLQYHKMLGCHKSDLRRVELRNKVYQQKDTTQRTLRQYKSQNVSMYNS